MLGWLVSSQIVRSTCNKFSVNENRNWNISCNSKTTWFFMFGTCFDNPSKFKILSASVLCFAGTCGFGSSAGLLVHNWTQSIIGSLSPETVRVWDPSHSFIGCVLWCSDLLLTLVPPNRGRIQAHSGPLPKPQHTTSAIHKRQPLSLLCSLAHIASDSHTHLFRLLLSPTNVLF